MSLTNIEYGSLASSEILNNNFTYLEKKIEEAFNSTMTSISSMLSNIATINTRLSEQAEMVENNASELSSKLDDCKTKTKIFMQKSCSLPCWNGVSSIDLTKSYLAESNGYLLLIPQAGSEGILKINSTSIDCNNSEFVFLPIKEGDVVLANIVLQKALFVPVTNIMFDNF